jgi:hypothetical protein
MVSEEKGLWLAFKRERAFCAITLSGIIAILVLFSWFTNLLV